MNTGKNKVVAAFETWEGGKSGLYTVSQDGENALNAFIENHYSSDTFVQLHKFYDLWEAVQEYEKLN